MKFLKITTLLLILNFGLAHVAAAQNFLKDYFNGNADSLSIEAVKLINMPEPVFKPYQPAEMDASAWADLGFEQVYKSENHFFTTRDKRKIFAYKFAKPSPYTIILLHGIASSGFTNNQTAGLLQQATQAEVYALDLRGHGQSDGKAGDVNYIDQYADDLADVVSEIRKEKPDGKIIVAGHSMGGGVALRYAMKNYKQKIDGYLLFAPLIGHDSPALPQEAPADDDINAAFMQIHFARIIGLNMLNEINDHGMDSLPVLFFNFPETMPLRNYSYRANKSMAPDHYADGLKSVKIPMLVLVGSKDEVFNANALQKAILENSAGEVKIVTDATHNGIRHSPLCSTYITQWFSKL